MTKRTFRCALLFWMALAAAPSRAMAQPAAPADASADSRADQLTRRGNAFAKQLQWQAARDAYREAWSLKRSYDIAGNLGISEAELGATRDAAEHLAFALRSFPSIGKPEQKARLQQVMGKVRPRVGEVRVDVNVDGAQVFVDGAPVGASPLPAPLFVEPGTHSIEARLAGHRTDTRSVTVEKGGTAEARLEVVAIQVEAGAPAAPPVADKTEPVRAPSDPSGGEQAGPSPVVIAVGSAVAAAGLGVAVGLTIAANGKSSDADALAQPGGTSACAQVSPPAGCADLKSALRDLDGLTDAAMIAYALAGLAAVGTTAYALWPRSERRSSGARVTPWVGATGGGVMLGGAF